MKPAGADDILPAYIFTLMHISDQRLLTQLPDDLSFIQQFRCSSLLNGHDQWILTSLQCAIDFISEFSAVKLGMDQELYNKIVESIRTELRKNENVYSNARNVDPFRGLQL